MARLKCTIKCPYKRARLNAHAKVYVYMPIQKCTFKWQDKSVPSNGTAKFFV